MAFKCLLTVLAFTSGSSSRQNLALDRRHNSFSGAVDWISSLIQSHAEASGAGMEHANRSLQKAQRAVAGINPAAPTTFSSALAEVARDIEENVLPIIQKGFADTQKLIDGRFAELQNDTQVVMERKMTADGEDAVWDSCIEEERDYLRAVEAQEQKLHLAMQAQTDPCALAAREASFHLPAPVVQSKLVMICDLRLNGQCDAELDHFKEGIDHKVSAVQDSIIEEEAEFLSAQQACDAAKSVTGDQMATLKEVMSSFEDQLADCLKQSERREVSICTFGGALERKCEALGDLEEFMKDVDGTGTEWSESERQAEFHTVEITRCLLQQLSDSGLSSDLQFGDEDLARCAASVNYLRDVGALNRHANSVNELTSEDSFNCEETEIEFSGFTWNVPSGKDVMSSQYQRVEHVEQVQETGPKFHFCVEPNPVSQYFQGVRERVTNLLHLARESLVGLFR